VYRKYFKRPFDMIYALLALLVMSAYCDVFYLG